MKLERKRNPPKPTVELLSTGCTPLDLALGGGLAWSKVVNVVGDKSTGKTLLVAEIIAQAKLKYGDDFDWEYDDAESGFSFDTKSMYGIDMLPEDDYHSITIEDFMYRVASKTAEAKLKGIKRFIYVVDSFDALTSEAELARGEKARKAREAGKAYEEGTYNLEKQRKVNEFFRTGLDNIYNNQYMLIVISQVRQKIGVIFGKKTTRQLEKVLDFFSSQIIFLSETEKQKQKGRVTGIGVKAKIEKNKIGKPFRECFFNILFDYGIDDIASCVDQIYSLKTDTGKTKMAISVQWSGTTYRSRSRLIQSIDDNNQSGTIRKQAIKKWNEIENSITPKRKSKY